MDRAPADTFAPGRQNLATTVARQIVSRSGAVNSHADGLAHHRGIRGVLSSAQRALAAEL